MSTKRENKRTCWHYDLIARRKREQLSAYYADHTAEQLLEALITLHVALAPVTTVLATLDEDFGPGNSASYASDLFPLLDNDDNGLGYLRGQFKEQTVPAEQVTAWVNNPEATLLHAEPIRWQGAGLSDTVSLLEGSASVGAASIMFGSVTMFEARNLVLLENLKPGLVDAHGTVADDSSPE